MQKSTSITKWKKRVVFNFAALILSCTICPAVQVDDTDCPSQPPCATCGCKCIDTDGPVCHGEGGTPYTRCVTWQCDSENKKH